MKFDDQTGGGAMPSKKVSSPIILGLLVVMTAVAGFLTFQNSELRNQGNALSLNLEDLDAQKTQLEEDVTVLDSNFQKQIAENDSLSLVLEDRVVEIGQLEQRLSGMRQKLANSQEENEQITARLSQLAELKIALEADIASLQATNTELRQENEQLSADLQVSREEVAMLNEEVREISFRNEQLAARLFEIAPAGFVAENFSVTARKRNEKLTARARQADEIKVAFDLNDVPEQYQTDEEIYLVVTKFDGNPIEELATADVTVKSAEPLDIQATDVKQTTLSDRQSVEMRIEADREMEAGLYNVLVYADHGFLGSTTFELR